jgi:O-acetyl-ADP-ribose deacetylase
MQEIANANLAEHDLPSPSADWEQINAFAHTFNDYTYSDKLHEIGKGANVAFAQSRTLPDSLNDLRACLFYEARRSRHHGYDPDATAMKYVQALVEAIRSHVRAQHTVGRKEGSMRFQVNQATVELIQGDIVGQDVDAIVNAANSALSGGGGVDGAIHRAAGPELLAECRTLGRCPTGEARITKGYRLAARYVIHAVGPVYQRREQDAELLASAYRNSLELAAQHGLQTIAFPAISTGIYGYPIDQAAPIALQTIQQYLEQHSEIELVRFVLWDAVALKAYERAARELFAA